MNFTIERNILPISTIRIDFNRSKFLSINGNYYLCADMTEPEISSLSIREYHPSETN
jgi:hypothetical protein